jgi:hypothetical protein
MRASRFGAGFLRQSRLTAGQCSASASDPLRTIPAEPPLASQHVIFVRKIANFCFEAAPSWAAEKLAPAEIIGVPTDGAAQKIITKRLKGGPFAVVFPGAVATCGRLIKIGLITHGL